MRRFASFVLLAEMRTGSNHLEANLNAMPGVTCHGEAFNPNFIGRANQTAHLGIDMAAREADPLVLLHRMREDPSVLSGFRFFHDHDPRVAVVVLADPACAKIVLTRNPLESYVSRKIAQATGQWKLTNAKNLRQARIEFDAVEFAAHVDALQGFQLWLLNGLQTSGQTAFYLDYEDIGDLAVLNGLATFLGVPALAALDTSLKKQNPEDIAAKVTDPVAMEAALAEIDRFDLGRTPSFEPRRVPGIPGFVAAREAPLLFLPIQGTAEAEVTAWLSQFGGLERDFVQKTLRRWKREAPGHRSFTVVRHPLARAHHAFCARILSGAAAELRGLLTRAYGVDLPKAGTAHADAPEHRAAFLAFLRFLKRHVAGQTGLRVDAHLASQSAVLQGFAQFQTPDAVLREHRLAEGLAWLSAEVGVAAGPWCATSPAEPHPLAAIYDAELEEAARDAYGRDYVAFGFADWTPPPVYTGPI